jgi:hypothetical protein
MAVWYISSGREFDDAICEALSADRGITQVTEPAFKDRFQKYLASCLVESSDLNVLMDVGCKQSSRDLLTVRCYCLLACSILTGVCVSAFAVARPL